MSTPTNRLTAAPARGKLMPLSWKGMSEPAASNFDCPHCNRHQVVSPLVVQCGACEMQLRQCLGCSELQVTMALNRASQPITQRLPLLVYPGKRARPSKPFNHLPIEVATAYEQACSLMTVHDGAAGAYARRALEIVLDGLGHRAPTLLRSIESARAEVDPDRRLPRRLLDRLDYIKEVGNFALHVRRGDDLAIIEVSRSEVEACLLILEDLLAFVFEEPGEASAQAAALNERLVAANKKPLPVSEANPLWSADRLSEEMEEA